MRGAPGLSTLLLLEQKQECTPASCLRMEANSIINGSISGESLFALSFGDCSFVIGPFDYNIRRSVYALIGVATVGWTGIIHGCVLLAIAYRLKWFSLIQFSLIMNQGIVDLMTSAVWAISATRMLIVTPFPCDLTKGAASREVLLDCQLIHFAGNVLLTLSQRSAFAVAFDRAYSMLFPIRWVKSKAPYRYSLIIVAWMWSVVQESVWLVAVDSSFSSLDCLNHYGARNDSCNTIESIRTIESCCINTEVQCLRHPTTLPKSVDAWLITLTYASDIFAFALTILFYTVIPALAADFCKRVKCGNPNVEVYWSGMEAEQQRMLVRVQLVTFATLINYFVTLGLGTFWTDILLNDEFGVSLMQTIGVALILMNTVLSVYLFAWKDPPFRRELKKLLKGILRCNAEAFAIDSGEPEVSDSRL